MAALVAAFLGDKQNHLNTGDITENSYKDYKAMCDVIEATLGKNRDIGTMTVEDFGTLRNSLARGKCKCNGTYRFDTLRSRLPPGEYVAIRKAVREGKTTFKTSLGMFNVADPDAFSAAAERGFNWRDIMGTPCSQKRSLRLHWNAWTRHAEAAADRGSHGLRIRQRTARPQHPL